MNTTDCASSDSKTRDGHRRPRHDCASYFFATSFTGEQETQGHSPNVFFSCMALVGASLLPDSSSRACRIRAIPSSMALSTGFVAPCEWPLQFMERPMVGVFQRFARQSIAKNPNSSGPHEWQQPAPQSPRHVCSSCRENPTPTLNTSVLRLSPPATPSSSPPLPIVRNSCCPAPFVTLITYDYGCAGCSGGGCAGRGGGGVGTESCGGGQH